LSVGVGWRELDREGHDVLTAVAVTASFIAVGQRNTAIRQRDQAIANQITDVASQLAATRPSLAAQLDVAANRASSTPDSETRLLNTTTAPLYSLVAGNQNVTGSVALSADMKMVADTGKDAKIWLWDVADPARPAQLGQPLTGPGVASLAFSPDGKILAGGSSKDRKVWLWSIADPAHPARLGQPLTGPADTVTSLAFSPDGKILAVGGNDSTVLLWDLADAARPARLGQPLTGPASAVTSVAFSPDGKILTAGTDDGTTQTWDLDVDDAIQRICATTGGTLTAAQWRQYLPQLPYDPPCARPGRYGLLAH
jgi:WD40 repeat protein